MKTATTLVTFDAIRHANERRCKETFHDVESWSASDWGNAMAGEFGEVAGELLEINNLTLQFFKKMKACDSIKKMLRQMQGDAKYEDLKSKLAKELADVVLYADMLSCKMGINLGEAVREKFNEVSEKRGSQIRL